MSSEGFDREAGDREMIDRDAPMGEVQLLGVAGAVALESFQRVAADATVAPSLQAKVLCSRLAASQAGRVGRIEQALAERSANLEDAISPAMMSVERFHAHTAPREWAEAICKLVVTRGLVSDVRAAVAPRLDAALGDVIFPGDSDEDWAQFPERELRGLLMGDQSLVNRLSLYARRTLGEAITQAQQVAARHSALTALVTGSPSKPGEDLAMMSELLADLVRTGSARLGSFGLQP